MHTKLTIGRLTHLQQVEWLIEGDRHGYLGKIFTNVLVKEIPHRKVLCEGLGSRETCPPASEALSVLLNLSGWGTTVMCR